MSQSKAPSLPLRSAGRMLLLVALAWGLSGVTEAPSAKAQPILLADFQESGQYVLYANRTLVPDARLYLSQSSGAYLIEAPVFATPILLHTRSGCVEAVAPEERVTRPDGGLDVVLNALPCRHGRFAIRGSDIVFRVGNTPARLTPKPPILGSVRAPALLRHTPEYGRVARQYRPDVQALRQIAGGRKQVRVVVFFGSWCHTCGKKIPRMLRVEAELTRLGANVSFDYWGLPPVPGFHKDVMVRNMRIERVPMAFLYIGEQNIGRIEAKDLERPETALARHIR